MKLQPSRHCFKGNVRKTSERHAGSHIWAFLCTYRYHLDLTELRSSVINIELGFCCILFLFPWKRSWQVDPATEIMSVQQTIFLQSSSSHNKLTAINHNICMHKKNKLLTVKKHWPSYMYVSTIDPVYVQSKDWPSSLSAGSRVIGD